MNIWRDFVFREIYKWKRPRNLLEIKYSCLITRIDFTWVQHFIDLVGKYYEFKIYIYI